MKIIKISSKHGTFDVFVDDEDYEKLIKGPKWCIKPTGGLHYAQRSKMIKRVCHRQKMHRFVLGITNPKIHVDHIDGNGLNNQKANLRVCCQSKNVLNRRIHSNNKSGYKGIFKIYTKGGLERYLAIIQSGGKRYYLGCYQTPLEAAKVYNEKAKELFGEFAWLNKILQK